MELRIDLNSYVNQIGLVGALEKRARIVNSQHWAVID